MQAEQSTARPGAGRPVPGSRRWLWIGLAAAAVLVLLVLLLSGLFGKREPEPQTAEVTRGDIEKTVNSLGSLQPKNYVDVGAQVSGQLVKVYFNVGDKVAKGGLLAEIDARVLESRVRTGKANIQNFQSQMVLQRAEATLAQQQAARNRRLYEGNAVSQDALQTTDTAADVAKARVAATAAQMASAQATLDGDTAQLGYAKIYAPIDGTVVSQTAYLGQTLNANQTAPIVLRVADLTQMTVEADVSEADVVKLTPGMQAYFTTLGDPNRRWRATVRQIMPTPEVTNEVVLYKVLLDVDNTDGALMTNMTAQVFFVLGEAKGALIVPVAALEKGKGGGQDRRDGTSGERQGGGQDGVSDERRREWRERRRAEGGGERRGQRGEGQRGEGRRGDGKRPTPYTVRVVGEDGPEERQILVGLMNRTDAQVLKGLKEGEKVILPTAPASDARPERDERGNRRFTPGPRL